MLHNQLLGTGLRAFGFSFNGSAPPMQRVLDVKGDAVIERWHWNGRSMYTTAGCSCFCDKGSIYRDEFIIHGFARESAVVEVLSYAMYFHMTKRSLLPADLIEVGTTLNPISGYTHLYVSVPFFLPVEINNIEIEGVRHVLSWLMPVAAEEAEFVKQRGAQLFEEKLSSSGYGFFDARTDLTYLAPN